MTRTSPKYFGRVSRTHPNRAKVGCCWILTSHQTDGSAFTLAIAYLPFPPILWKLRHERDLGALWKPRFQRPLLSVQWSLPDCSLPALHPVFVRRTRCIGLQIYDYFIPDILVRLFRCYPWDPGQYSVRPGPFSEYPTAGRNGEARLSQAGVQPWTQWRLPGRLSASYRWSRAQLNVPAPKRIQALGTRTRGVQRHGERTHHLVHRFTNDPGPALHAAVVLACAGRIGFGNAQRERCAQVDAVHGLYLPRAQTPIRTS